MRALLLLLALVSFNSFGSTLWEHYIKGDSYQTQSSDPTQSVILTLKEYTSFYEITVPYKMPATDKTSAQIEDYFTWKIHPVEVSIRDCQGGYDCSIIGIIGKESFEVVDNLVKAERTFELIVNEQSYHYETKLLLSSALDHERRNPRIAKPFKVESFNDEGYHNSAVKSDKHRGFTVQTSIILSILSVGGLALWMFKVMAMSSEVSRNQQERNERLNRQAEANRRREEAEARRRQEETRRREEEAAERARQRQQAEAERASWQAEAEEIRRKARDKYK